MQDFLLNYIQNLFIKEKMVVKFLGADIEPPTTNQANNYYLKLTTLYSKQKLIKGTVFTTDIHSLLRIINNSNISLQFEDDIFLEIYNENLVFYNINFTLSLNNDIFNLATINNYYKNNNITTKE